MTTIITRLYSSHDQAEAAANLLASNKLPRSLMSIVSGSTDAGAAKDQISALGVYPNAAQTYASKVAGGNALLVVHAGFGKAYKVTGVLAETDTIDAGVKYTEVMASDMSSRREEKQRHLPELLNITVATGEQLPYPGQTWLPFHSLFRFPLLSGKGGRSNLLDNKLFSKMFGMPMLIKYRES